MNIRSVTVVAALLLALPAASFAQAGSSQDEKDKGKIDRTGRDGALNLKGNLVDRPVMTVPAPKTIPDYSGPIPYVDDNGRIRNLHDKTFMSEAEAKKAPWFAEKNINGGYDAFDKETKRKLSPALVVDPAKERYLAEKKANGGKVPKVEVPEGPKPTERKFDKVLEGGKVVDAKTLSPEAKKAHDAAFTSNKEVVKGVKVDPKVEVYSAGGTGKLGFDLEAIGMKNGEIKLVDDPNIEIKAKVAQLEGTAVARAKVGADGVEGQVSLEGKFTLVGVQLETAKAKAGDKNLGADIMIRAEAAVLAEAKANAKVKAGLDGVELVGDVGAFAGAKFKVEVPATVNVGGTETRVTAVGEVSYGVGAEGKAYLKIDWKTLSVKGGAKGHAALGVGAGGEVNIDFSAAELVKQLPTQEEIQAGYDAAVAQIDASIKVAQKQTADYIADTAARVDAANKAIDEAKVKAIVGVIDAANKITPEQALTNPTAAGVKVAVPVLTATVEGAQKVQQQIIDSKINKDAYNMRKAIQASPVVPKPVERILDSIFGYNGTPNGPGFNGGRYGNTTFGAGDAMARTNEADAAGMWRM